MAELQHNVDRNMCAPDGRCKPVGDFPNCTGFRRRKMSKITLPKPSFAASLVLQIQSTEAMSFDYRAFC
jgi:hypothetical protein